MTARTRLIQASLELRRKVLSSKPWGLRVANLLFRVRFASDATVFGQAAYGLFLLYGVEGMPTPPFMPKNTRDIIRLKGYGSDFGKKVLNYAMKLYRADLMKVERSGEALSLAYLKLISDPGLESTLKGKPLKYAENYVYATVKSVAFSEMRKEEVRHREDVEEVVHEPSSWGRLVELFPVEEQDDLVRDLERSVNLKTFPDIVEYFKLLMSGFNTQEIADGRMLPSLKDKPMTQQGLRRYEDVIMHVLEKHFGVS